MARLGALTLTTILLLVASIGAAPAAGDPVPVPVKEAARATQVGNATIDLAPDGSRFLTWFQTAAGGYSLRLTERPASGGPFTEPVELSTTGNFEPVSLSFTPDGVYAAWGIATNGVDAEQSVRPAGGSFGAHVPLTGCRRFLDTASGPDGRISVTCARHLATNPPDVVALLQSIGPGPVFSTENLGGAVYDPFIQPRIAQGSDGTLAVTAKAKTTTTPVPPVNETSRIYLWIRGSGSSTTSTLGEATWPDEIFSSGRPAITTEGAVATTVGGTDGAKLFVIGPGFPPAFSYAVQLEGTGVSAPAVDRGGTVHVMSADAEPPDRVYRANTWTVDGGLADPVRIPLAGKGDPYVPFNGFSVTPDGTEFVLIRAGDGTYATSRDPGSPRFRAPRRIGPAALDNPRMAITPRGDLLAVWPAKASATEQRVVLGGLERSSMKVKAPRRLRFKALARRGVRLVVNARPAMRLRVAIGTSRKRARKHPLRVRVVRRLKNRHVLRVKPRRGRLGKRRNLRVAVRVTGTTAAGAKVTKVRMVRVRR